MPSGGVSPFERLYCPPQNVHGMLWDYPLLCKSYEDLVLAQDHLTLASHTRIGFHVKIWDARYSVNKLKFHCLSCSSVWMTHKYLILILSFCRRCVFSMCVSFRIFGGVFRDVGYYRLVERTPTPWWPRSICFRCSNGSSQNQIRLSCRYEWLEQYVKRAIHWFVTTRTRASRSKAIGSIQKQNLCLYRNQIHETEIVIVSRLKRNLFPNDFFGKLIKTCEGKIWDFTKGSNLAQWLDVRICGLLWKR